MFVSQDSQDEVKNHTTMEFVGMCVPASSSILPEAQRTTMDDPQLKRTRQRIGVAFALVALTLLVVSASQHRQSLLLRHSRRLDSGEPDYDENDEKGVWSFLRRLSPLSRDEVHAIIFERHDEPYPDKPATF